MKPQQTEEFNGLLFTPYEAGQAEDLAGWIAGGHWPYHGSVTPSFEKVLGWIADGNYDGEDNRTFWIYREGDVEAVAIICLHEMTDLTPVFDLRIREDCRKRGLGRIILSWLLRYLFTVTDKHRIEAHTRRDNIPMQRLLESGGWVKEAHYRKAWPDESGGFHDALTFAMLKDDWERLESTETAGGRRGELVVLNYQPDWAIQFAALKLIFEEALGESLLGVEHVGSTSVPGLAAKPVLDIDLVVAGMAELEAVRAPLARLGYHFRGDLGIPGRYAFGRRDDEVPRCNPPCRWMKQNLYVCLDGVSALKNHILFRDALRRCDGLRDAYGALKRRLVRRYAGLDYERGIDLYCRDKTGFITAVLASVGVDDAELDQIVTVNTGSRFGNYS